MVCEEVDLEGEEVGECENEEGDCDGSEDQEGNDNTGPETGVGEEVSDSLEGVEEPRLVCHGQWYGCECMCVREGGRRRGKKRNKNKNRGPQKSQIRN